MRISRRKLLRNAGLAVAASSISMAGFPEAPSRPLDRVDLPEGEGELNPPGLTDNPTAPTESMAPAKIDRIWHRASSGYDGNRNQILERVRKRIDEGPFRTDWQSLSTYEVPDWYRDAKFGIFIHWGLYAVPAFGSEQYPHAMYAEGSEINRHHVRTYGPLTKFGYKDFIPLFTAKNYDPAAWARLFKSAGAKYVVPVFEHHDGFAMYDSDLSRWTAQKMGPRRDLAGELAAAVRAAGLHLGASSHRIEHDWFMSPGRKIDSDLNDPRFADFYGPSQLQFALDEDADNFLEDWTYVSQEFISDWLARAAEVVEKYHPELFYFDFWIGHPQVRPYLAQFAAYFYNQALKRGSGGVINYKLEAMHPTSAVLDLERGVLGEIRPVWQNDTSISNKSWGYIENDVLKTPEFIVRELIDVVSKNGNLLMNVGPRADGTIPDEVQETLKEVGAWLEVNGEAIYGTRPWSTFGEGPTKVVPGPVSDTKTHGFTGNDFRFTSKGGAVYAMQMERPTDQTAFIRAMGADALEGKRIGSISLLGSEAKLRFQQQAQGLRIELTSEPRSKYPIAYRVRFAV